MFLPADNDVVSMRAYNAERLGGGSVKWLEHTDPLVITDVVTPTGHTWDKSLGGILRFRFEILTAGVYKIYFRCRTVNVNGWLWVSINGQNKTIGARDSGRVNLQNTDWEYNKSGTDTSVTLSAGEHVIECVSISSGLYLDGIVVVPNANVFFDTDTGNLPVEFHNDRAKMSLVYPADGSRLVGTRQRFTWVKNDVVSTDMSLELGTAYGLKDLYDSVALGTNSDFKFAIAEGLPIDGSRIYGKLVWVTGGGSDFVEFSFLAYDQKNNYLYQTHTDWLLDATRDRKRVFILELDSAEQTFYFGSQAFMSDDNHAYDDFMVESSVPIIESSLRDDGALGNIDLVYPVELPENLLLYNWQGHRARGFYGDVDWPRSKFRQVAGATIQNVNLTANREYGCELKSDVQKFNRTFHVGDDISNVLTVQDGVQWVLDQYSDSGDVQFINLDDAELDQIVKFDVTESTTMIELLRTIVRSVDVELRIAQIGFLEIIKPDVESQPSAVFNGDNIVEDTIKNAEIIPAYKRVTVIYANGVDVNDVQTGKPGQVTTPTAANTGALDNEIIVESFLRTKAEGIALGEKLAIRYSNKQFVYSMELVGLADITQVGDFVAIAHPELEGSGVVVNLERTPLCNTSVIEVLFT